MAETKVKKKTQSAIVTEKNASNNPFLEKVVNSINDGYRLNRTSGQAISLPKHRTAMTPNDKPIWIYKRDKAGNKIGIKLLFGAGWYLSSEEVYTKEELLKQADILDLNERLWEAMENQGIAVEKTAGSPHEVRVVSGLD